MLDGPATIEAIEYMARVVEEGLSLPRLIMEPDRGEPMRAHGCVWWGG